MPHLGWAFLIKLHISVGKVNLWPWLGREGLQRFLIEFDKSWSKVHVWLVTAESRSWRCSERCNLHRDVVQTTRIHKKHCIANKKYFGCTRSHQSVKEINRKDISWDSLYSILPELILKEASLSMIFSGQWFPVFFSWNAHSQIMCSHHLSRHWKEGSKEFGFRFYNLRTDSCLFYSQAVVDFRVLHQLAGAKATAETQTLLCL